MRPRLVQRQTALAAVALLAGVGALAITAKTRGESSTLPRPEGSYAALAGAMSPAAVGRKTACGGTILAATEGVAHPTLPCGARIYVVFHGRHVLTQVVDRGPYVPGREFDVTPALAQRLDLQGVQRIRWSYARIG
jgi:rare lipoprotein A (peptidoglycan hydrolase)